jgi:hypothetical protein
LVARPRTQVKRRFAALVARPRGRRGLPRWLQSNRERPPRSSPGGRNQSVPRSVVDPGWSRPSMGDLRSSLARSKSAPHSPAVTPGVVRERSGVDRRSPKGGLKASRSWVGVVGGWFKTTPEHGLGSTWMVANLWRRARGSARDGSRPIRIDRGGRCGMVATISGRPRGSVRDGCDHFGPTEPKQPVPDGASRTGETRPCPPQTRATSGPLYPSPSLASMVAPFRLGQKLAPEQEDSVGQRQDGAVRGPTHEGAYRLSISAA